MVHNLLASVQRLHPQLEHWYRKGRSRKGSDTPIDVEDIASELKQNLRDDNRLPIAELGYSFGAWNGANDAMSSSISIKIGNTSGVGRNSVIMTFGTDWKYNKYVLEGILREAVSSIDPEHGILMIDDTSLTPGVPPWDQVGDVTYSKVQGFTVRWKT